jgi:DNA helicase-2/ATP-dependent DNA helicase PcrA
VVYRSNAQSRVLEEAFLRAGIDYRIYGGLRFFERAEIRNALAYLRLVVSRSADAAFERIVNLPPRGLGEKTLDRIRGGARAGDVPLWEAARELLAAGALPARAAGSLARFVQLVEDLDEAASAVPLAELMERILDASGLLEHHGAEKGERGQTRVDNLRELVAACRQFELDATPPVPTDGALTPREICVAFVDQAALEAGETQAQAGGDAVQMMTLHAAKGLEFPVVFMTGLEEGLFPHRMSLEEPGRLEEERRLCYVGITRAMRRLHLTYAESRRMHGQDSYNALSRFVREIPRALVEEVRVGGSLGAERGGPFGASETAGGAFRDECEGVPFRLGQTVRHRKFGDGVVLQIEGRGERARIQVSFEDAGARWLLLGQARLEPLD